MKSEEKNKEEEEVIYISHRIPPETAGGKESHCSKCGEAVPTFEIDDEVRREENEMEKTIG